MPAKYYWNKFYKDFPKLLIYPLEDRKGLTIGQILGIKASLSNSARQKASTVNVNDYRN